MSDGAAGATRPDHDTAPRGIENPGLARGIEKAAAVKGFAHQPAIGFDPDGVDHAFEFRGRPDRVAQRERRRLVRHG